MKKILSEKISGKFNWKTVLIVILCAAVLLILAFCARTKEEPAEIDRETPDTVSEAPKAEDTIDPEDFRMSTFDNAVITYLCDNGYESENFLISPVSLRAALCLAAAGAQGNTRTELVTAAGFSGMETFNGWYSGLNKSAAYRVQNSVWTDMDLIGPFSATYEANVKERYDAGVFSYTSDEMNQATDDWLREKTEGAVTGTQNLSGVSSALVNTLYLQADWRNSFSEATGFEGTFTGADGSERTLDYMERTGEYYYVEEDGVKVLVMSLEDGLSFVCFLGNRTGRFDKVTGLQKENVHVVLPRITLASTFDGKDLVSFLLSRGVNDAISPQTANFYNMCQNSDWYVQEVVQEIRLETSEQGVGTAAPSVTADAPGNVEDAEAKEFIVDGPCSFAIFSGFGTDSQYMLLYGQLMQ